METIFAVIIAVCIWIISLICVMIAYPNGNFRLVRILVPFWIIFFFIFIPYTYYIRKKYKDMLLNEEFVSLYLDDTLGNVSDLYSQTAIGQIAWEWCYRNRNNWDNFDGKVSDYKAFKVAKKIAKGAAKEALYLSKLEKAELKKDRHEEVKELDDVFKK